MLISRSRLPRPRKGEMLLYQAVTVSPCLLSQLFWRIEGAGCSMTDFVRSGTANLSDDNGAGIAVAVCLVYRLLAQDGN